MTLTSILPPTRAGAVLDAIADNSLSSVMVTQAAPGTPIVYVNDAFTALTGYTPEDVMGKSPRMLQGPKTDETVLVDTQEQAGALRPCKRYKGQIAQPADAVERAFVTKLEYRALLAPGGGIGLQYDGTHDRFGGAGRVCRGQQKADSEQQQQTGPGHNDLPISEASFSQNLAGPSLGHITPIT